MRLNDFNSAPPTAAAAFLSPCADVPRWITAIVEARPFASPADLLAHATTAAPAWTEAELDRALQHHPRIGERAQGASTENEMSRREQSGVDTSADAAGQLLTGNREYEAKFGRVFLIRAAGRNAEEILTHLQSRLNNTPEQELPVVAEQLREIALIRLEGLFTS
ncbi:MULTISPECIES: 2-oxo-4-hydroxy-4-carboxy-5-ureidoimidazoline decarboxylase [unclassified Arthrobacter]|uniref:2-oxo-4-hydroxy-4-carboxy-5-ureidoimidazoline decarboxylase n=1 Tax=unclassified Arthrobacter TaxID=235627 RepID=UPI00149186F1|nr:MULTISPECIES: 2-oxo-4-hydroxy-4-carboxy-5-ureidoimidazoline decarboxylase [unclassified Arthrobacter]MBE0009981.1 2-oxo-4-hydroxy-4-carboxy-5-ureidoimidazoline decarboxylase [Arthrobacter sp. AET 35A]NOJ63846.1 2-oxo-4-hydroxy-4-carboxy-5-ureidoimidazoline decarboxylase [Arthrobacter sp. 147(2020)]